MLTMRNQFIGLRVDKKEKKKIEDIAKEKDFRSVSAYLYWLIRQALKTLCLVFIFGLLGCASVSYLPSNQYQSFPPVQSVQVLYEKPDKAYIILGKVIAESGDFSDKTLFERLKRKAMKIGAEAIILENTQPAGVDKWGSVTHRVEGLAIRWKE